MRFLVTMNMPSYSGNLVHQMTVEHSAETLDEFVGLLMRDDFIIVEELYKNPNDGSYYSRGNVALNHQYVGKIKALMHYDKRAAGNT